MAEALVDLVGTSLSGSGHYVSVGPIQISLANLVVICLMILVFVVALVVPFPRDKR